MLPRESAWRRTVLEGLLTSDGMIGFGNVMSADEVESIRAYVSSEATAVLKVTKP